MKKNKGKERINQKSEGMERSTLIERKWDWNKERRNTTNKMTIAERERDKKRTFRQNWNSV